MAGGRLAQPHSAVTQQNYSQLGSHTIGDASQNAHLNQNHSQRMLRVRQNQQINNPSLMRPAKANGSQLPPASVGLGMTMSEASAPLLWGGLVGSGVGLLSRGKKTKAQRLKILYAVMGLGAVSTAGTQAIGWTFDSVLKMGVGALGGVCGLVIMNRLNSFSKDGGLAVVPPLKLHNLEL